ncbi:hypothetical protein CUJ91_01605 [Paraburkholderia graminis]|nr:hypothetical protein CUJ91_01605 [Paraburkholderia graminis]
MRAWMSLKTSFGCFMVFPLMHKKCAAFRYVCASRLTMRCVGACTPAVLRRVSPFGARRRLQTLRTL